MTCSACGQKPEFRPGIDTDASIAKAGTGDVPPAPSIGPGTGIVIGLALGVVIGGVLGVMLVGGLSHEAERKRTLARRRSAGYAY